LKRTENSTRTWRSVEDATQVVLSRFHELQQSLHILCESKDTTTITGAQGLLRQLEDFRIIICLHINDDVLNTTGPCLRIFQAPSTDLAVAVNTITTCKSVLQLRRSDRNYFDGLINRATQFAQSNGLDPIIAQLQRRKIRR
jgi:hypothetical protein